MFKKKLKALLLEEVSERIRNNLPGIPGDLEKVTRDSLADAITDSTIESVKFATMPEVMISALAMASGAIGHGECTCRKCIEGARQKVEDSFRDMTRSKN